MSLTDPRSVRGLAEAGSLAEAYRALLGQVERHATHREASTVLAIWQWLAGDADAALGTLAATPCDRENWLQAWIQVMPVFEPLRARPEMQAIVARLGFAVDADASLAKTETRLR